MTAWWLTWLWQGLALTLVMSAAFRLVPHLNAATRYCMWWGTLAAVAWLGPGAIGATSSAHATHLTRSSHLTHLFYIPSAPETLLTTMIGVWVAFALVALGRLLPSVHAVCALRDRCRPIPAEIEAQLPLWLETQGLGRATRLMLCDEVPGATVLGFARPCIALPSPMLHALTRNEIDQVVLHEYAHVQRWDDWARLGQALLQSALWVHPAVALIGRQLNLESEMACDEWVVARTGQPKVYAHCLTRAAEARGCARGEPILGPALLGRKRDLIRRVDRLLAVRSETRRNVSAVAAFSGGCALVAMVVQFQAVPFVAEVVALAPRGVTGPLPEPAETLAMSPVDDVRRLATNSAETSPKRGDGGRREPRRLVRMPALREGRPDVAVRPIADTAEVDATDVRNAADRVDPTSDLQIPPSIAARSFDGRYRAADTVVARSGSQSPWRRAGAAGAQIGDAARDTSLGIADMFTRAGVSLARRF